MLVPQTDSVQTNGLCTHIAVQCRNGFLFSTAANVSNKLTALASEAVKFGSDTLIFVGEFLLSELVEL